MATPNQRAFLAQHNPIIATLPRGPRKESSRLQSMFAGAVGRLSQKGIKLDKPDQSLYLSGYADGMRDALKWPNQAKPAKP